MKQIIVAHVLLWLTVTSEACVSDRQCPSFHRCTQAGDCVEVPKLGLNCSMREECQKIDSWADCIDDVCKCTSGTVDHGYECVNLRPAFGKSRDAKILFYVLLAITSVLAFGLGVAEIIDKRCKGEADKSLKDLLPEVGCSNDAFCSDE